MTIDGVSQYNPRLHRLEITIKGICPCCRLTTQYAPIWLVGPWISQSVHPFTEEVIRLLRRVVVEDVVRYITRQGWARSWAQIGNVLPWAQAQATWAVGAH